jgi:hypothetical protein
MSEVLWCKCNDLFLFIIYTFEFWIQQYWSESAEVD